MLRIFELFDVLLLYSLQVTTAPFRNSSVSSAPSTKFPWEPSMYVVLQVCHLATFARSELSAYFKAKAAFVVGRNSKYIPPSVSRRIVIVFSVFGGSTDIPSQC